MNDLPEANPTYWLEIRQTRRNYLFYTLLYGGILAGAYLFLIVSDPNGKFGWAESPLVVFPFAVYGVGSFSILSYVGTKLASQLVNEDLSLQTPLRAQTILWGKLQVAMTLSLCLFVPSLPGAAVLAFMDKSNWLLLVTAAPIVTIGVSMIGLGFMAGAKTPLMRGGMIFLHFVFVLGNLPVVVSLVSGFVGMFLYPSTSDIWAAVMALSFGIMLLLVSSLFIFSLGLAILQRNRNLVYLQFAIGVLMVLLIPVPLLLVLLAGPDFFSILGFFLLVAAYFVPPILALRSVRRYYDKRRVLSK